MRRTWDVIVVGSGPAGSVAAGLLAQRGRSVLLLERGSHPRPKPCGEFVNPGAWAALERTGFVPAVRALEPTPVTGWELTTWEGAHARASYGQGPGGEGGFAVARARLDQALAAEAVARGARLEERHTALWIRPSAAGVAVETRGPRGLREDRAQLVLIADGLRSRFARQLGAVRRRPRRARLSLTAHVRGLGPSPTRGWLRLGGGRTVGTACIDAAADLWNVTVVVDPTREGRQVVGRPAPFFLDALGAAALPWREDPVLVAGPWASGPFDWPVGRPAGARWALLGDAAGYFDPLTGQGVHQAVLSAEWAAADAERALADATFAAPFRRYARLLRDHLRGTRAVQRLVAAVVEHDAARRIVLPRLEVRPSVASALIRVTGDQASPTTLLRPRVWGPLLWPGSRPPVPGTTVRGSNAGRPPTSATCTEDVAAC